MPSAVVLSHYQVAHELGHLEPWLDSQGFAVNRIFREDRPSLPNADLLIVMGSPTSVATGFCQPAGDAEIDAVAAWVASGRHYLGLCFGAQVLAAALGGRVTRLAQPFIGYVRLATAANAPESVGGPWTVWHNDVISAPPGADVMGAREHADLAFRVGRAWGLQPHVEATPESLVRMAVALEAAPRDYADLVDDLHADADASASRARDLLDAFLNAD